MKHLLLLAIFLRLSSTLRLPSHNCLNEASNNNVKTHICKNISDIFAAISPFDSYHFKCLDCNITTFSNETFPFENKFLSLNVTKSGIQKITTMAFSTLSRVEKIYLQENEIADIAQGAFSGLNHVQELHLEFNHLINIHPGFVDNLTVVSLNLSHNKIWRLPNKAFKGSSITQLDLSNNRIRRINGSALYQLENLELLSLENNKICHLPIGMFKYVTNLKYLNLARNRIEKLSFDSFSGLKWLVDLNLGHNFISVDFMSEIFAPFFNLERLDLSSNGINDFNMDGFDTFPRVRELTIDDNLFSCGYLVSFFEHAKKANIEILNKIPRFNVRNINGIICTTEGMGSFYKRPSNLHDDFKNFLATAEAEAKQYDQKAC